MDESMAVIMALLLISTVNLVSAAHNSWGSFHNFSGCHAGDHRNGLASVKQYFHQFGYIPKSTNFSDVFDDTLRSAILTYQNKFHLNTTGRLDNSTIDFMVRPRCGVADVINSTSTDHRRNLYSYFPGRPTWDKTTLTYSFSSSFTSISPDNQSTIRTVFARAFARWSEVTTITFMESSSPLTDDIRIGFFSGDHGDGEAFDGALGTLAHAFAPTNGRLHLDADERWLAVAEDAASPELFGSRDAIDLESVAVHEIGHLLGLGHSTVENSIMYPLLTAGTRKVQLADDDVLGIQSLYGTNPSYSSPGGSGSSSSSSQPPPSTATERDTNSGSGGAVVGRRNGWTVVIGIVSSLVISFV